MSKCIRPLAAALAIGALLGAAPAAAQSSSLKNADREASVPVVFDVVALRPVGLMMTGLGTAAYAIFAPFMLVTRPTDMGKPFSALVVKPARYTFVDPLGLHPPHS